MILPKEVRNYKWWIVLFSLIFVGIIVYSPHFSYPYPLHADEWHHIGEAKSIINGEYGLSSVNSFESGYRVFLALLEVIGLNLVLIYKFLPAIFSVLGALALFALTYYLTKDYWASLFSIIFFASLKSNINLLGLWFAVPSTLAIPLIYLSIFLFTKGFENSKPKEIILSYFAFFALLLIHPVSSFFVIAVILIFLTINFKEKDSFRRLWKVLFVFPVLLIISVSIIIFVSNKPALWFLQNLIFLKGWTPMEPGLLANSYILHLFGIDWLISPYFIPVLFGVLSFVFAMAGLYFSFKEKKLRIFSGWVIYSFFTLFIFVNFNFSPLVPYQRMIYYSMLGLVPLAGIGLSKFTHFLRGYKRKEVFKILAVIIIFIVFFSAFYGYWNQDKGVEIYHLADDKGYEAAAFLGEQPSGIVLATPEYSSIIPAISGQIVMADLFFKGTEQMRQEIYSFFEKDCAYKKEVISKYKPKYIFSKIPINCENLQEAYNKELYIYRVIAEQR